MQRWADGTVPFLVFLAWSWVLLVISNIIADYHHSFLNHQPSTTCHQFVSSIVIAAVYSFLVLACAWWWCSTASFFLFRPDLPITHVLLHLHSRSDPIDSFPLHSKLFVACCNSNHTHLFLSSLFCLWHQKIMSSTLAPAETEMTWLWLDYFPSPASYSNSLHYTHFFLYTYISTSTYTSRIFYAFDISCLVDGFDFGFWFQVL